MKKLYMCFYEKSCGVILFRKVKKDEFLFLTVKYRGFFDYWGLVKGHVEKNEGEVQTAFREVYEEVGLSKTLLIKGFREVLTYQPRPGVTKLVVFFLAEAGDEPIQFFADEHTDYRWLPFSVLSKKLTYLGDQRVVYRAIEYLLYKNKINLKTIELVS